MKVKKEMMKELIYVILDVLMYKLKLIKTFLDDK
jgi:hypothetical protein